jgi:hypothetical protein
LTFVIGTLYVCLVFWLLRSDGLLGIDYKDAMFFALMHCVDKYYMEDVPGIPFNFILSFVFFYKIKDNNLDISKLWQMLSFQLVVGPWIYLSIILLSNIFYRVCVYTPYCVKIIREILQKLLKATSLVYSS